MDVPAMCIQVKSNVCSLTLLALYKKMYRPSHDSNFHHNIILSDLVYV